MIDQQTAENAQEFVFHNAPDIAKAKAELEYLTEFRKSKKAILSNEFRLGNPKAPQWQCDNYAYSNAEYLEVLQGLKEATEAYEELRFKIESAKMKVQIWQTQSANQRT